MSDDFNPTPSMVKDALAAYAEGDRAPWVERWLAAAYARKSPAESAPAKPCECYAKDGYNGGPCSCPPAPRQDRP